MANNNSQKQKEYRLRKCKTGKYINIFVPNDIAIQIKGNPGILLDCYKESLNSFSKIGKLQEENARLRKTITCDIEMLAKKLRKEIEKEIEDDFYRFNCNENSVDIRAIEKLKENFKNILNENSNMKEEIKKEKKFRKEVKKYIDMLVYENKIYIDILNTIKEYFKNKEDEELQKIFKIIEDKCNRYKDLTNDNITINFQNQIRYDFIFGKFEKD